MDKRYQVFISSTFKDLEVERSTVFQTLMEMDCIPAGMELFPSIDEEQWEFIKKVIDDSDYYLLIIGGRYGTVANDGLSYTEKEFDYAVSKGIKVIVLIHENPEILTYEKSEKDPVLREKLFRFIEKASSGRLRKTWSSEKDLPGIVSLSMNKTIKTYPSIGWIRADKVTNEIALQELNSVRKINLELQDKINELELRKAPVAPEHLAPMEQSFKLNFVSTHPIKNSSDIREKSTFETSWNILFSIVSPYSLEESSDDEIKESLNCYLRDKLPTGHYNVDIDDQTIKTLQIQFKALGLLDNETPYWKLTPNGHQKMMELRTIKKEY